jgi:two-component system, LytTR family, sensor kinase
MLVSAAWIIPAILGAVNQIAQQRISGNALNIREVLFSSLDWLLYALLTPAVFALSSRWPLTKPGLVRHAVLHLMMALLFCVAWAGLGTLLKIALQPDALWGSPPVHFMRWLFITLPFGVAVYLAVVGIEHAIRSFVEIAQMAEQLSSARLAALQARVNPHFLFNTLNTIGVLVRDGDRQAATRILEQFSDVMRRTLSRQREQEVTLREELDLVHQYLAIEQARFADRLHTEFEIDPATLPAAVPSFAVQQLVENAIRHGIAKSAEGGTVTVRARKTEARGPRPEAFVEIFVIDDGAGLTADPYVPGHAIENARERLQALYGSGASLVIERATPGGTIATMRMPYRELVLESDLA